MMSVVTVVISIIIVFSNVSAGLPQEFEKVYQNHVSEILKASKNTNLSEICQQQLNGYYSGLLTMELWAWKMFDANAKFPSGLMMGNAYSLGTFDECLEVSAANFDGKYCLSTIPITELGPLASSLPQTAILFEGTIGTIGARPRTLGNEPQYTGLHFGHCIPDGCSAQDASQMFVLEDFTEKFCYSRKTQPEWTAGAITAVTILGVFALLVIASTGYDTYLHYTGKRKTSDLAIAFSYLSNGRKLLSSTKNSDHLLCLNGLKVFSMLWIVLAHEYVNGSTAAVANYVIIPEFLQATENMFVVSATLAVDTFFVIGGLVTLYTFLKAMDRGIRFNLFTYYIHRYLRLTPALAVVVMVSATLLRLLGEGPLWNGFDDHLVRACTRHWWAALLYIQNYVHDEQACVPQSWYLSIDMQLFVLSPLVLLPLKRWPKFTLLGLVVLSLCGILVPFLIAYFEELEAFMTGDKASVQKFMFSYYEQTYGRFGAYVIGLMLGYVVYQYKTGKLRIKLSLPTVLFSWGICSTGLVACVYAGHHLMVAEKYDKLGHSLYIAFDRPAWSLAISGIILLCLAGYGGPVNSFLSAPICQFGAKLSYGVYLVHYQLIWVRAAGSRTNFWISHFQVFFNFCGTLIFSTILALILHLTFESPVVVIERAIFSKSAAKGTDRQPQPEAKPSSSAP